MFRKLVGCLGCEKDQSDRGDVADDETPSQPVNLNEEEEEGSKSRLPTCVQGNESSLSVPSLPDPVSTSQLSQRKLESEPKGQNLWVLTKERPSPEDQKCFETGKQETMEKTMEEIRGPHGKNINVPECFQGMIKSVSQVQEIIKNAVSLDPTGHAPQAWAVVSMGLTLVKNDIERRDAVMEASGFLANNLSYYATIDKNDRNRQVENDEHLEEALVKFYTAILEYTAEVYRASRENVWKSDSSEADKLGASRVLIRHAGLEVTESMMENTASRRVNDTCDFDELIQFCIRENIPMPGSERAMWIAIERFHDWWTVRGFLEYKPDLKITLEKFDALVGNESVLEFLMESLLERKDF
ncbi:hypothetical protein BDV24DRAFT_165317 [Aspergillus arachidicola]|uniref:NWD NACHT-NTPase N-terminal domain-containing protein n=1 Tax=Aspergillus arachidicola TaxID=656916 RepID=A0A5N6Y776_9EURO|nr:hypothetical protein BDV24DRAFT_165317 [Aspergillus arachidicola]